MIRLLRLFVLQLFLKVFKKDLENVEPEVDLWIANIMRDYIKGRL